MHRCSLAALVIAVVLAACTAPEPSPEDPASEDVAGTTAPPTALAALDEARGDGTDPVVLAITEFSLLFGDVPGALPIAADDSLPISGTGAVDAVAAVFDDLTDEQQAAVRRHLQPWRKALAAATQDVLADGTGHRSVTLAAGRGTTALAAPLDESVRFELRDAAEHVFDALGGQRPASLQVALSEDPLVEGDAVTRAGLLTAAGGVVELVFGDTVTGQDCSMVLGPRVPDLPLPMLRSLAAHEMFHCWSVVNSPSLSAHSATPDWYQEGVAAWIGEDYAGGSDYSSHWWRLWLTPSTRPVRTTAYSAIGFWAWADQATGGLLPQVAALHAVATTGDEAALYGAVLQALDDEVVTGLAASRSRRADWGAPWDLDGPGITTASVDATPPLDLPLGDTTVEARPATLRTATYTRPTGSAVLGLEVAAAGHVRARWSDGTELTAAGGTASERWCLADPCECPDGTAVLGWEVLPAAADVLTVAVTGAADRDAAATMTVEQLCEEARPPPADVAGDSPLLGTWRSQPSSLITELDLLFADTFASATYAGGDVVLRFAADGTMEVTYEDVTVLLQAEAGGPRVPLEISGGGTLDYTIEGSNMSFSGRDWTLRFRIAGVDGDLPISDEDVPDGGPTSAVWGITQGTLTLQTASSDVFLPNQYRRR